jgi:hypothetical protein
VAAILMRLLHARAPQPARDAADVAVMGRTKERILSSQSQRKVLFGVGLQQRRTVLCGGALLCILVPRLLYFQGESGVNNPTTTTWAACLSSA